MNDARRLSRHWIFAITVLSTTSIGCARCAPGLVGEGVSRLTMRNAGSIIELINADTRCGFESDEAKASVVLEGTPGDMGAATWTINQCDIDLTETPHVTTDCAGNTITVGGKIRVSGTRTIHGQLTGDYDQPAVPGGPEAVEIKLEVEFEDFYVDTSEDKNILTQREGKLSFTARPKLAVADSTGVCMIATPNIKVADIRYENARVRVQTGSRDFEVPVATSDLWAVNGVYGAAENQLSGRISVWDVDVDVDPGDGLNPEYDPNGFGDTFSCTEDLRVPVTFMCESLGPRLAQGAARLTAQTFGNVVSVLDKDTNCGFSSSQALASMYMSGEVGGLGNVEVKIDSCTLDFPVETVVNTDCNGKQTSVMGRITVSGSKFLEGRLTGDSAEPVVPMKDGPARIELTEVKFEGFTVKSGENAMTWMTGGFSGRLHPRVAMDSVRGACSIETGIARFEGMEYKEAHVRIVSPLGTFEVDIDHSDLRAVNGSWNGDTNLLRGKIVLDGEVFDLPTDPSDDGLDPEYDQARFDASWQTCGDVAQPPSFDCHFVKPLAQGASQLSIQTLGALATAMEADEVCGFKSPQVLDSVFESAPVGEEGEVTWEVSTPCELTFPPGTELEADCNGVKTMVSGTVYVTGTKTVKGFISGHRVDAAVPNTRDAATLSLSATFENFRVWRDPSENALGIRSGELSGTLRPRLAIDTKQGACALPTPVASFDNVTYKNAELVIVSEGKTFEVTADNSMLVATNGKKDGMENFLAGTITIDGERVVIPTDPLNPILDPEYDAARFDSGYQCNPDMQIPQYEGACRARVKQTIAEGAARLLLQNLGAVTKLVNENSSCGFESNLTDPDRVVGNPGQMGEMEWSIRECEMRRRDRDLDRPTSRDCLETGTYYSGAAIVNRGRRLVRGLREDITFLFLRFNSIKPRDRESVTVFLEDVSFDNFRVWELPQGETEPNRALTIHSGYMSATVQPILGENDDDYGTYDIPTPVAKLQNVVFRGAPVTLLNDGMTFKANIDSANLEALNGAYQGRVNEVSGEITVDGVTYPLPLQDLDPDYDQAVFDSKYVCEDDLVGLVPPN